MRIWKTSLSKETIANWMYREVDSTHSNYPNLSNYYTLNEGSGIAVQDSKGSVNGILKNGQNSHWKDSSIQSWSTDEDKPLAGKLVGSDADGSSTNGTDWNLNFEIAEQGFKGTAEITGDNQFTYTPYPDENGSDTFTYRVRDAEGNCSNTQGVKIAINPVDDPPGQPGPFVSPAAGQSVPPGTSVSVSWGAAADIDNDPLAYTADFYNGSSWTENVYSGPGTSFTYTIPSGINTTKAKFRVKARDASFFSIYRESSEFTIGTAQYTLNYIAGAGGSITGATTQIVSHGSSGTEVMAVANKGCHFVKWSDGKTEAARTDTNVTGDITVTAIFALNQYTLIYTAGAGGSITGTSTQTVSHGSSGTEVIAVANQGCHFVEWSDGKTETARTDTSVTGDITVTANFAPNQYTVTFKNWDGSVLKTETVNHGSGATAPLVPDREGYTFAGWDSAFSNVTSELTVKAVFEIMSYNIFYHGNGANAGTTPASSSHEYKSTVTVSANSGNLTKAGYSFAGWNTKADGNGTNYTAGTGTFTMGSSDITLYAKWDLITYSISYNLNGGTNYNNAPSSYTVESATIILGIPARTGYTFNGWYGTPTGGSQVVQITKGSIGDINLYASWTANSDTAYQVKHYQQDVTGSGYTLKDTDNLEGTTDTTAAATAKSYTGFTENTSHSERITSGVVKGDDSLVLKLYYDRNTYTVNFNSNSGSPVSDITGVRYEATVTEPDEPERSGYTFAGWCKDAGLNTAWNFAVDKVTADTTLYAKWTANTDTDYKVQHYQQDVTGPGYTLKDSDDLEGTTDTTAAAAAKTYTGFTENTSHSERITSGVIAGDGSLVLKLYYDRNTYTVNFNSNSGSPVSDITGVRYEATVTEPDDPEREGYTFAGWCKDAGLNTAWNFALNKVTADTTLYAKWTANTDTDYKVQHYQQDISGPGYTLKDSDDLEGTTDTTAAAAAKTYTGFTENTGHSDRIASGIIAGDGSLVLKLYYDRNTYTVNFNSNSGSAVSDFTGVRYEATIAEPEEPEREGYTFAGWCKEAGLNTAWNFAADKVTADTTLYAKWTANTDTDYKVQHYQQDVTGPGYTLKDTDDLRGTTDMPVTGVAKTYTGFTENTSHSDRIASGIIKGDDSLVLKLYYDRNTYTVNFNSNSGSPVSDITGVRYEATIAEPDGPEREGYTFAGWYSDPELTEPFGFGTAITGNTIIYAKWDLITYSISYNLNGGINYKSAPSNYTVESPTIILGAPIRSGYAFAGWYDAPTGGSRVTQIMSGSTGDIALYARWAKESSYEAPASGVEVLVNGKGERDGKASSTKEGEKEIITITVDEKKLEQKLEQENYNAVVTIPFKTQADIFIGQLSGPMVKFMENKQAVIEIETEGAAYIIPAQQINIDAISEQIEKNAELKNITVQIQISKSTGEKAKLAENSWDSSEFTIAVPSMEFTVRCIYENSIFEVNSFSRYAEIIMAIPDEIDPNKITTGVIIEPDGTLRHIPTKITVINGKYYAKINSFTSGTYSVIWNPLEFEDAASHWARVDINDLGSRLIVSGVNWKTYQPDIAITRAEFAAILVRALGLKTSPDYNTFTDVKAGDWYYESIATAAEYNLIFGVRQGEFRPLERITREQAMVMIGNAMKITGLDSNIQADRMEELLTAYVDGGQVSEWAKKSVAGNLQAGIVTGKPDKSIAPKDEITRAEVAVIIKRLLQKSDLI